jgi:inorganic triphosphatase YgiF
MRPDGRLDLMAASLESELKYQAETDADLQALATPERLGPATLGPARTVEEVDRYLDTPGHHLARAHWAARLRTRDGVTRISLKGPPQHAEGATLHERPELEGPTGDGLDPATWPPSPASRLLLDLSRGGSLSERLRLVQQRTERQVLLDGRPVGLLSLDRARVERAGTKVGILRVVELELAPEALAEGVDLALLERALSSRSGLAPDRFSKLERALALIGEERV